MKIVFATGNKGKLREAGEILGPEFIVTSASQIGLTEDIPETGTTLKENSLQKARYLFDKFGVDCFADDTGLEVEALGGAPGIFTARYAGDAHDSDANMDKLLGELNRLGPGASRKACFRTVVTLIIGGRAIFFEGVMEGQITEEKAGCGGFGYDPIFIPDEYPDRTLAELPEEVKNEISHRGRALRAMSAWLHIRMA